MDDITKLWENFTLIKEEEDTIVIDNQKPILTVDNIQLCAVGKLHPSKRITVEAFASVMKQVWKIHNSTRIETAGLNIYVIAFKTMAEKIRVFSLGPWTFDKSLLILVPTTAANKPLDIDISLCAFWVQIHYITFECMTKDMAKFLGARLGEVEEVDGMSSYDWVRPFLWVRVKINVLKPLRRGLKVKTSDGKDIWCPLRYERLPDFCYGCGCVGHSIREYEK
ncbi:uncharacterized protein LOC111023555 [Momordica charantia]|uniref:Uncharacterized protein LOC111023555 n=1 Tax=Momordica charantia TaxID=3673 RepID=A0A6J1DVS4_MOMCH|nr:uncharacterized protein LOC111023555 [Momordica charantia]